MRPITLRIEGFRSFGTETPATIDFGDRDLIAIVGDTGAGKSSILEAMTYVLYGQTSFAGNANQEVVNDQSPYCEVSLQFWADNYQWEARRRLERKRGGEVGKATAVLVKQGDADEPLETTEGVHQVNRRTAQLLGLDAAAFLRTMVLPQGRFARLLAEDEPRNRSQILRQIWRTDEIDAAGAALKAALERAGILRERLEADLDHLPEDPTKQLRDAERAARSARAQNENARRNAAAVREHIERRKAIESEHEALEAVEEQIRKVRPDIGAADRIGETAAALTARAEEATAREAEAVRELAETRGPEAGEEKRLDDRRNAIETALRWAEATDREEAQEQQATAEHEAAVRETNETAKAAERATEAATAALERSESAGRRAAATQQTASEAEKGATNHEIRFGTAIAQQRQRLTVQQNDLADAQEALETASTADAALSATAEETEERAAQARARNLAAATAHGHQPGDACPVCERELPEEWLPPDAPDMDTHTAAARDADDAARKARRTRERAEARAERIQDDTERLNESIETLEQAEEEAALGLNEGHGLDPWATATDRARAVEGLQARAAATAETARDTATAEQDARQQAGTAQAAAGAANTVRERESRRTEETAQAATAARKKLAEALEGLQETLDGEERTEAGNLLNDGEAEERRKGLEELQARTTDEIAAVRERADEHRRKTQAAIDARTGVDRVRAEQEERVTKPLEKLLEQAHAARELAVQAIAAHGLSTKLPTIRAKVRPETARTEIRRLAAGLDLTILDTRNQRDAGNRESKRVRRAVETACSAAGIEAHGTTPENAAATIQEHAEKTSAADYQARDEVARLRAIREPAEQLLKLHERVKEHESRLNEIADGLRPSRFPKWLTLRRSTDLLRHGSRQLEKMSGGRYAFADPRETAEEWKVIDRWSGAARSPASLSGGEQFMAALALSLGMVETMGERGGRLECMFLDEGFGTLDRQSLDEAVEALYAGARPDHMIGVITHVREVAERMPAVLRVERQPGRGSRAKWLAENERHELLGEDGPDTGNGWR